MWTKGLHGPGVLNWTPDRIRDAKPGAVEIFNWNDPLKYTACMIHAMMR
jgi:hypothetical protein